MDSVTVRGHAQYTDVACKIHVQSTCKMQTIQVGCCLLAENRLLLVRPKKAQWRHSVLIDKQANYMLHGIFVDVQLENIALCDPTWVEAEKL